MTVEEFLEGDKLNLCAANNTKVDVDGVAECMQNVSLCIDYRAWNKKMVPDRQPVPRIQDILDGLGRQEWFTTLDMPKALSPGIRCQGQPKIHCILHSMGNL